MEDLVRVFSVTQADTVNPDLKQFIIWATLIARPSESLQLQTLNAYAASLCYRAKETNRTIAVTWYPTRYGPTLKTCHFLKGKDAA